MYLTYTRACAFASGGKIEEKGRADELKNTTMNFEQQMDKKREASDAEAIKEGAEIVTNETTAGRRWNAPPSK